jgi:hypothetical protein
MKRFLLLFLLVFVLLGSVCAANLSMTTSLSESTISEGESTSLTVTLSGSDTSVIATLTNASIGDALTVDPWQGTSGEATQSFGSVSSSTSQTFTITGNTAGTYELSVTAQGAGASAGPNNVTLTVSTPALVATSNDSCDPASASTITGGSTITVDYTISNTGGSSTSIGSSLSLSNASVSSGPNGTSSSYSTTLNASSQTNHTWVLEAAAQGTTDKTVTITPGVTAGSNDPSDPSACTYTITGSGDSGDDSSSTGGGGGGGGGGAATTTDDSDDDSADTEDDTTSDDDSETNDNSVSDSDDLGTDQQVEEYILGEESKVLMQDGEGNRLINTEVFVIMPDGTEKAFTTDSEGYILASFNQEGEYSVSATLENGTVIEKKFNVVSADETPSGGIIKDYSWYYIIGGAVLLILIIIIALSFRKSKPKEQGLNEL